MTLPRTPALTGVVCAKRPTSCAEKQPQGCKYQPDLDLPGRVEIDVTAPTDSECDVIASSTKKRPQRPRMIAKETAHSHWASVTASPKSSLRGSDDESHSPGPVFANVPRRTEY
jgi:hypothetical protein